MKGQPKTKSTDPSNKIQKFLNHKIQIHPKKMHHEPITQYHCLQNERTAVSGRNVSKAWPEHI